MSLNDTMIRQCMRPTRRMRRYPEGNARVWTALECAAVAVLLLAASVVAAVCVATSASPVDQRADYNVGRYDCDRATAIRLARAGIGKTDAEMLAAQ